MRINKVILSNVGAYFGHYEVDLSIKSPTKNVILFGGKNGAGKTTLLEAIRLALFGPYTYGFRTENDQYYKRIQSLLNKRAIQNKEQNYQIILEFDRVENYERSTYKIKRSWTYAQTKIKENVDVIKNGQYLSERENEIFNSKLRQEMPPQLFELCLFDGEEISRIITDNKLSVYLQDSARVLFNLHLFESLEQDIGQYMKQATTQGNKSELELQLEELENQYTNVTDEQQLLLEKKEELDELIANNEGEVRNLKNDFDVHGGLVKEERDSLLEKLNAIEQQRKENIEKVRSFITGLLPIFLVQDLLNDVQVQMTKEQENESFEYVSEALKPDKLTDLVGSLKQLGMPENTDDKTIEQVLLNGILSSIKPEDSSLIHRASFNQRSEVTALVNQIKKVDSPHYLQLFNENQKLLKEAQKLRKKIENNDKNEQFKDMFESIEQLNQQNEKTKLELIQIDEQLTSKSDRLIQLSTEIDRLKERIIQSAKSETTLSLSVKIGEVSKKFRQIQLQKKLQQVEIEATRMANKLFRKEEFLNQIKINPIDFTVTLLTPSNEEIDQQHISAGEKELLLLSIIWAMFKTSGIRMPFVFDTLLGRLDQTHRERLLTKLIPSCGEQVIILATDSEIDTNLFQFVKPVLSKTFTLDYDKEHRKVELNAGKFFDINVLELSS
ncbi:DNA sulfur modification protein DndD [Anaerobacillus sp. MEB173]|uniref:DNA sulfur modification protein DndD n=1 Tax=Anaerobacillus sp. MEB173 TaxID=3383345 RepID=UPI003F8FEC76